MITGRSLSAIRSAILATWSAGMTGIGLALDQAVGSWAYELADSLAVDVLRIEGSAEALGLEIFPSTATTTTLERQTTVQGQARQEGEVWQGTATVTGTPSITVDCTGRRLIRSGKVYAMGSGASQVVMSGGGSGTVNLVADAAGIDDITVGATLTWDSAPTGLNPTALVATITNPGIAEETSADLAERAESYRRARPAGGNPAHLIELAELHERVAVAYCYPTLAPNPAYSDTQLDTPGAVVVIVAGAAQGTGSTNTRELSAPNLAHVAAYFAGTEGVDDSLITGGSRLYCAQLNPADVGIENASYSGQNADITVTNDPAYPLPWTGSMSIFSGTTTSVVANGDETAKNNKLAAIQTAGGGTSVRGRVEVRNLGVGVYDGGTGRTTFTVAALGANAAGSIDPAPSNWVAIRDAVFGYFDTLGPGDVPDAATVASPAYIARRRRFPPESWSGPSSVTPAAIIGAAMRATGVVDVSSTTPAAITTPNPKTWLYLSELRIRFM